MVVCGSKKSFKSMLTSIHLAFRLALGQDWLGFATKKSSVYVLQVEIPQMALKDRIDKYIKGHNIEAPDNLWYWTTRMKLDRVHDYNALKSELLKYRPSVLILDCMYKLMQGNMLDNYDVVRFTDMIDKLVDELPFPMAVILIHHKGKVTYTDTGMQINRGTEASLGAISLNNWYDSYVGVTRLGENNDLVKIEFEDLRLAVDELPPMTLKYNKHTIGFHNIAEDLEAGRV